MKKNTVLKILFIGIALFTLGCGNARESAATNEGAEAPSFMVTALDGKEVSFDTYLKKDPILLVFFATWCPPCRKEVPELIRLQGEYGAKGLKILAVSLDDSRSKVESFVKGKNITYTVFHDGNGTAGRLYNVLGIPTNILINKKGVITFRQHRLPSPKEIESVLI
jgi:peroxiredoxin